MGWDVCDDEVTSPLPRFHSEAFPARDVDRRLDYSHPAIHKTQLFEFIDMKRVPIEPNPRRKKYGMYTKIPGSPALE